MPSEAQHASVLASSGVQATGWGVLTGWGQHLPSCAVTAARGCRIMPLATPVFDNERLRRATRECLLGVAAVEAALAQSQLDRQAIAGPRTALVYASASSYAAANWHFVTSSTEQALYFPYTAPSAVPAEVTIQFGITGPYLTLLSGANAGVEALWQAATLLVTRQCDRALVLSVEIFQECAALYQTGRWLLGTPLLEAAACVILERSQSAGAMHYRAAHGTQGLAQLLEAEDAPGQMPVYLATPTQHDGQSAGQYLRTRWPGLALTVVPEQLGICLACAPLIALMQAMSSAPSTGALVLSQWWDAWSLLRWPGTSHA